MGLTRREPYSQTKGESLESSKANKITGGTDGNIVTRNASGDIQDSGSSVANVLARANHTGSQAISTITDLQTNLDAKVSISNIVNDLTSTDTNKPLSANQGKQLQDNKVSTSNIVDNLTSTDTNKPLSANQGKVLQDGKANKITSATNNNFIKQDANGDIVDAGISGTNFNGANQLVKLDSSGKLVAIDGSALTNVTASRPTGSYDFSIADSVVGALACDESSYSKTTYSDLYALITAKLGANALEDPYNSSNFILGKDFAGRVLGLTGGGRTLFEKAGSDTHTLTTNEIPAHAHAITGHIVFGSGTDTGSAPLTNTASGYYKNNNTTTNTGGGQAHNIVQKTVYIGELFVYH